MTRARPWSRTPVLSVTGATKTFGAVVALDGVDLEVTPVRCWPCWATTAPASPP